MDVTASEFAKLWHIVHWMKWYDDMYLPFNGTISYFSQAYHYTLLNLQNIQKKNSIC